MPRPAAFFAPELQGRWGAARLSHVLDVADLPGEQGEPESGADRRLGSDT
ncbi:MAG: hypothetical protein U5K30_03270 [Acidimicrobiales bacterium]|nr:hypothetical protein [Acidimicrobiales bacterium]